MFPCMCFVSCMLSKVFMCQSLGFTPLYSVQLLHSLRSTTLINFFETFFPFSFDILSMSVDSSEKCFFVLSDSNHLSKLCYQVSPDPCKSIATTNYLLFFIKKRKHINSFPFSNKKERIQPSIRKPLGYLCY